MSEQNPAFPRPGDWRELHDWASQVEAQQSEAHNSGLQAAVDRLHGVVAGMLGVEALSDEQEAGLGISVSDICRIVASKAQHDFGPRMAHVFDGDAMNA